MIFIQNCPWGSIWENWKQKLHKHEREKTCYARLFLDVGKHFFLNSIHAELSQVFVFGTKIILESQQKFNSCWQWKRSVRERSKDIFYQNGNEISDTTRLILVFKRLKIQLKMGNMRIWFLRVVLINYLRMGKLYILYYKFKPFERESRLRDCDIPFESFPSDFLDPVGIVGLWIAQWSHSLEWRRGRLDWASSSRTYILNFI